MKEKPHLKRFDVPRCDQPPLFNLPRQAPVQMMTTHIYTDKNNNSNNEDRGQYEHIDLNVWSGRQLSVDNANNKYADKDNNNINEDNKDHIMMNTLP